MGWRKTVPTGTGDPGPAGGDTEPEKSSRELDLLDARLLGLEPPTDIELIKEGLTAVLHEASDRAWKLRREIKTGMDPILKVAHKAAEAHYQELTRRIDALIKELDQPDAVLIISFRAAIEEMKEDVRELSST